MKYALIGGSGTLGTALLERLAEGHDVVCFSRGEHAQKRLAERFPAVDFRIGDVRDAQAVHAAVRGCHAVFLLAAIKHVDVAQRNPLEAVKTNILGAVNVAEAAVAAAVNHVVFSNTDKAVLPITSYGYSKALAQDYLLGQNRPGQRPRFSSFAWGNVVASQGSAIPIFIDHLIRGTVIPLTDPRMSRFWLTIDQAADFILAHYRTAPTDRAMIPPVKGATVLRVIETLAQILGVTDLRLETVGVRGVEKYYEVLESTHERCLRSDTCPQYTDAELDAMLRPVVARTVKERPHAA